MRVVEGFGEESWGACVMAWGMGRGGSLFWGGGDVMVGKNLRKIFVGVSVWDGWGVYGRKRIMYVS